MSQTKNRLDKITILEYNSKSGDMRLCLLPGRLAVGRMTLDHVIEGSNPSPAAKHIWRYRLGVRTGGSQPSNQGSIPCSATISFPKYLKSIRKWRNRRHNYIDIPNVPYP